MICHLQILCTPFHSNQCVTLDKLKTFEFQIHVSILLKNSYLQGPIQTAGSFDITLKSIDE